MRKSKQLYLSRHMLLTGQVPPLIILSKDRASGIPAETPVELDRTDPSELDTNEFIRRGRL